MHKNIKFLGIIQPGRIGDIIICLPIAEYYKSKGYDIIWPVDRDIIKNFIGYISYVHFIETDFNVTKSIDICLKLGCNHIINLTFRLPGQYSNFNDSIFQQSSFHFDELKYKIANVSFKRKYHLNISRNYAKENSLFNSLNIIENNYAITHTQGSDNYNAVYDKRIVKDLTLIEINTCTESVFDWILVLEKAKVIITVDSCFANLCNQLKIQKNKYFLKRPHPNVAPSISKDWIIIE